MSYSSIQSNAQSVGISSKDAEVKRLANLLAELAKRVKNDVGQIEADIRRIESRVK